MMNTRFVHALKRSLFSRPFVRISKFTTTHEESTKKGSFYRVDEPGIHDPWLNRTAGGLQLGRDKAKPFSLGESGKADLESEEFLWTKLGPCLEPSDRAARFWTNSLSTVWPNLTFVAPWAMIVRIQRPVLMLSFNPFNWRNEMDSYQAWAEKSPLNGLALFQDLQVS